MLYAASGAGQAAALSGDVAKSEPAKRNIFALIDRVKPIDPLSAEGIVLDPLQAKG